MPVDSYDKLYLPGDTLELTDRSTANPKGNPTKVGNPTLNKSRWVNNSGSVYQTDGAIISNTGVVQGWPATIYGNPVISNSSYAFGNSSGYFDGVGDSLKFDSSIFAFGTEDFTIDFWINCTATTSTCSWPYVMSSTVYTSSGFGIYIFGAGTGWGGTSRLCFGGLTSSVTSTSLFRGTGWKHVAIVRNGVNLYMFVNGVLESTYVSASPDNFTSTTAAIMAPYDSSTSSNEKGYLQELRISKGIARWTSNFTPPTSKYTTDAYTKLLLHFEGENNSTIFLDSSMGEPISPFSTYGYFNGSSYLTIPDSSDWYFATDPFTVDFRINFSSLPANNSNSCLLSIYTNAFTRFSIDLSAINEYHTTIKYNTTSMTHATSSIYNGATINVSDGSAGSYWQTNIVTNQWISIDLGTSKSIWKFLLCGYSGYPNRTPKNFRVEGSSDNSNWNTTYSGITLQNTTPQEFTLPDISASYRYWRIYMIDDWGDASYIILSRFELYTSSYSDVGMIYNLNFNPNDASVMSTTWSGIQTNTWYHVALVRSGLTDTRMYINGSQIGNTFTTNYTVADASSLLVIGASITYTLKFNGYLDEFRISKGIARWTSNFTPQTTNYTTDYYTKLLLHFDNINNSTIIADDSKSMYIGNYTSAVYLNGSNYLYMNNANDYNFGNNDFTIELWYCPLYLPPANQWRGLVVKRNTWSSRHCYSLEHDAGNTIGFYWSYDGVNPMGIGGNIASGLVLNTWYHISVSRKGSSCYTSFNGVITFWPNVFSGSIYYSNDQLNIGRLGVGDSGCIMTGYLTDVHISKGITRYTKDFIPPTTYRPIDQYSKLALRFNDYNGSTFIYDWYEPGYLPGYGSTYFFSGSSCNCYWGDSADWYLGTGDFTIEFLFRRNAFDPVDSQKILQQWSGTSNAWIFYFGINSILLSMWPGPNTWQIMWPNYDDNWHHIAFVRDAINSVKSYIDGIQIGTTASGIYTILDSGNPLYLGGVNSETNAYSGWLTNFKISKGIARYTSNFTSPLASGIPYVTSSNFSIERPLCVYSGEIKDLAIGDYVTANTENQFTCSPYVNIDFSSYDVQSVTLTCNTLINLSNISNGKRCRLIITQDDVGSRTISFTNFIRWPMGLIPKLSTIGGATDIYIFIKSRDILYGDCLKNF